MFGNQTKPAKVTSRHPEFATYMTSLGHFAGDVAQDDRLDTTTRMQILKHLTAIEMLLNRPSV